MPIQKPYKPSPDEKTLYFDITGMTCNGCAETITSVLARETFVKNVNVNFLTARASVVVTRHIPAETVMKIISEVGFGATKQTKFEPVLISDHNTFYYVVSGMTSERDAAAIEKFLIQHNSEIQSCNVRYSTQAAEIRAFVNASPEKIIAFNEQIIAYIQSAIPDKTIVARELKPVIKESKEVEQTYNN